MINETITIDRTIDFLNELIKIDKKAVFELLHLKTICNEELANHPTVQCGIEEDGTFSVGLLGILNGLFGIIEEDNEFYHWGMIAAIVDSTQGEVSKFVRVDSLT